MSRSRDAGAPSNSELAQRTARIEEQVDHVAETVDRIEDQVTDDLDDVAAQADENAEKVAPVHAAYRVAKWGVPIGISALGGLAALGAL